MSKKSPKKIIPVTPPAAADFVPAPGKFPGPPALMAQINDEIDAYARTLYSHAYEFGAWVQEATELFQQRLKG